MERITRDQMLMDIAKAVAKRGTCSRLHVGAVFSRDGRVISQGYNGAPAGLPHCIHESWVPGSGIPMPPLMSDFYRGLSSEKQNWLMTQSTYRNVLMFDGINLRVHKAGQPDISCTIAEHAERNGIAFAARHGVALDRAELTVTHAPCLSCAMAIINSGIIRVVYETPYRLTEGVELLAVAGLQVVASIAQS